MDDFWRVGSIEDVDEFEMEFSTLKSKWQAAKSYLPVLEEKKKQWAFTYTHNNFVAGVSSTQCQEMVNCRIKSTLLSNSPLLRIIDGFDAVSTPIRWVIQEQSRLSQESHEILKLRAQASFARSMATRAFDTWIVEVRGADLSTRIDQEGSNEEEKTSFKPYNTTASAHINGYRSTIPEEQNLAIKPSEGNDDVLSSWEESQLVTKLTETLTRLTERVSGYISESQLREISDKFFDQMSKLLEDAQLSQHFEDVHVKISRLLEAGQNYALSSQIGELSRGLVSILEKSHRSVSPPLFDLHERLSTTIEDF
ncbi:uncharacterized protein LOC144710400 [Wolffia australiana]